MKRIAAAALAVCLLLSGCAVSALDSVWETAFSDLGPDFHGSYANFRMAGGAGKGVYDDDEKICSWFESVSVKEMKAQPKEESDSTAVEISFDKFHGKQQYFYMDLTEEQETQIGYDMQIEEGRLKLVLVHGADELQTIAEIEAGDEAEETIDLSLEEGEYRLLLVGDEALNGSAELTLNIPGSYNEGMGL
ncbi:hypothetical protein [Clostridium sp. D33t1_170424_F3]|uniref:hypothetical protein n=1 Tax=Clostridium sp. D33t1_170424_F3 TaxID=2787099 RepID=UPI0018A9A645|nr:hypothetical protein [Clostridium sp. D33t1_170424_F3]